MRDDADLLTVRADQPHLGDADPVVDPGLGADGASSICAGDLRTRKRLPCPKLTEATTPSCAREHPGGMRTAAPRHRPRADRPDRDPTAWWSVGRCGWEVDSACTPGRPPAAAVTRMGRLRGYQHPAYGGKCLSGAARPHPAYGGKCVSAAARTTPAARTGLVRRPRSGRAPSAATSRSAPRPPCSPAAASAASSGAEWVTTTTWVRADVADDQAAERRQQVRVQAGTPAR